MTALEQIREELSIMNPSLALIPDDELIEHLLEQYQGDLDPDTYLQFSGQNQMNLAANGYAFLTYDGTIKINDAARDRDTQILADDGNVVLHVDAGTHGYARSPYL